MTTAADDKEVFLPSSLHQRRGRMALYGHRLDRHAGKCAPHFLDGVFAVVKPGHDAWGIGNEAYVVIDWKGFTEYAKR